MMLAVCLCGWLKSLETPEGNPPDLQRDSTVGSVGRLLVWTACIPYNTTPVNRPAHINTALPTAMDEQAVYRETFTFGSNSQTGVLVPQSLPCISLVKRLLKLRLD